ncbi:MAG: MATE family efflux transporter [Elusimicrobiales bacterium]|nr:MATE family efflux transporter [Elusimicrobiales bacterium]
MNFLKSIPDHILVAGSSWISRIITSFIQIYMIKVLIDILGVDKYAVFSVLLGIMGWFMLCDLGSGVSLQNYISEYRAKNKNYDILIKVLFFSLFFLSLLFILILYFVTPFFSKFILGEFDFLNKKEIFTVFFISGSVFVLMNLSNSMYKIWYAEMKGYISNIIPTISYLISFFILFLYEKELKNNQNGLLLVFLIYFLPSLLISIFFILKRIIPFNINTLKDNSNFIFIIYKRGFGFWIFAFMASIVLQIDYIVMAKTLSTKEIVIYNIVSRVFMFGFFIYNSILASLWPVFSEKISKGDLEKVKIKIKKYIKLGIIYMIFFIFCFIIFKNIIINLLAPNANIEISFSLIILFGFYYILRIWTDMYSMVLQSANILKPFYILVPFQAFISVFAQIFFVKKIGVYGIVLGLIFSFLLTVSIGLWYYANKYLFDRGKNVG